MSLETPPQDLSVLRSLTHPEEFAKRLSAMLLGASWLIATLIVIAISADVK